METGFAAVSLKTMNMETKEILNADILDIIFEGRNKEYGAYELRKSYNKRILTALFSSAVVVSLLYSGYLIAQNGKQQHQQLFVKDTNLIEVPDKPEKEKVVVPPKPPEAKPVKQISLTSPLIVPYEEVPENEKPPTQEEIGNARIGLVNVDGEPDDGRPAAPIADAGKDVIITPEKHIEDADNDFVPVEIEAEYPGGLTSWTRFLIKTLTNYPAEAIEKGVQGTVVVKFIVDREGNVSQVEAASGPEELREAAIKAIKKSGKWIPGQQNGRYVKSYKMQPITFRITE